MTDKRMPTLDEHNVEFLRKKEPAGVACPKCGEEMVYQGSMSVSLFSVGSRAVVCPSCRHHGAKLV